MKSLKGKIIAGTIAAGVITSAGAVFANTDAGNVLQDWYDGMFQDSVQTIQDEATAYGTELLPELQAEYNGIKEDATTDINATRDTETGESIAAINLTKDNHLESLGSKKQEILSNMEKQFYDVYMEGWLEIQRLADEGQAYAENDLTDHTGAKGQEAVNQVTADLTTATDAAVMELEEAIRQAKEELSGQLTRYSDITVKNLKKGVDFAILELREEVNRITDELVAQQQEIITAKAQNLEDAAKAEMDEVVSGIGN
ncbi:hypothetical protein [Virgibacillus siamensis]|uniref:hypothetical protein n=1 Tax=Virgibacillus siamensis TaxID=480071 RepID=UPI00098695C2|nr:hypothetical protein [Virgibacillus siamensis]